MAGSASAVSVVVRMSMLGSDFLLENPSSLHRGFCFQKWILMPECKFLVEMPGMHA
jgi:hypothetical protein